MRALRLNRFRITTRVFAGFGCLIGLGLAVAAFDLYQLANVEREGEVISLADARITHDLTSMLTLETMRRTAESYRFSRDHAAQVQFGEA